MAIISVDFFGNLNADADFWQEFLGYVVEEGHKIYVISGPWPNRLGELLTQGRYIVDKHYHAGYSILSHLSKKGHHFWFDEDHDSWYSHEYDWWKAKAEICQMHNVSLHLDSDNRFAPAFRGIPTRFLHTESEAGKNRLLEWANELKQRNTYEDWEDEYMYMMGVIVPM
jgi:hypothetical protein